MVLSVLVIPHILGPFKEAKSTSQMVVLWEIGSWPNTPNAKSPFFPSTLHLTHHKCIQGCIKCFLQLIWIFISDFCLRANFSCQQRLLIRPCRVQMADPSLSLFVFWIYTYFNRQIQSAYLHFGFLFWSSIDR